MIKAALACVVVASTGACTFTTINEYGTPPDAVVSGADAASDLPVSDTTSCGQPLPEAALSSLRIEGAVMKFTNAESSAAAGATISLVRRGTTTTLATATADSQGEFVLSAPTGGRPVDGFLRIHVAGYIDTVQYPAVPYATDVTGLALPLIDGPYFDLLKSQSAVPQDPNKGMFITSVIDCAGMGLAGARLSLLPAGTAVIQYLSDDESVGGTTTASSGLAIVHNTSAGAIHVDGATGAVDLRGQVIIAELGVLTQVNMSPTSAR